MDFLRFSSKKLNYIIIIAGASWEALRYGASNRLWPPGGENNLVYEEFGGLGFVKNYIVDSHFR